MYAAILMQERLLRSGSQMKDFHGQMLMTIHEADPMVDLENTFYMVAQKALS